MSFILKNRLFKNFCFGLFLIAILSLTIGTTTAVPANPTPFELVQPDGFAFTAKLIGDEHGAQFETIEGYTIIEDDNKWWTYAQRSPSKSSTISANYVLSATENRVGHVDPQQLGISKHIQPDYVSSDSEITGRTSTLPLKSPSSAVSALLTPSKPYYSAVIGTENAVVILINFTDTSQGPSYTPSHYDNLLFNQSLGANSMYNYYKEVSYGKLNVTGTVGSKWYPSARTLSYYGADSVPWDSIDDANGNIYELAREAVRLADYDIDFSHYDKDSDGIVDHVIIVHAGAGQESISDVSTDIWSHKGSIAGGEPVDGVRVEEYIMLAESSPLGTFAHEFGHDLGLPDLYDTINGGTVVGSWCLMDYGSWANEGDTPTHLSAWCKIDLGWITPTLVNSSSTYFINQIETSAEAYKITTPELENQNEYFLVENRENVGYDQYLPDAGILIWHIDDYFISLNRSDNRINAYPIKGIVPELPDGILNNATYSANDGQTAFNTTTTPNSNTNANYVSNVAIENIGYEGTSMRVDFFGVETQPPSFSNETPTNASFTNNQTPLISINVTDTGIGVNISTIVMKVNGSDVDETITPITNGFHVENLTAQSFGYGQLVNVSVTASDNASNSLTYNWSFTVDGNAPVLTDTAANPQTIESNGIETTTLSVNVTDDISEISSVTINLSSIGGEANVEMQNTNNNYWIITNATGVGNDTYYLPINATDNAGNSNTSVNITLYVNDTISPTLSNNMPATGTSSLTPTISINATDIGSGINISSANMTVNSVEVLLANTKSTFTYNFSNTTTIPYNYSDMVYVTFNVSDNEGHTQNDSWEFYIDNVDPTISITSPAGGYSTTASTINVSGTVNGTGSPPVVTVKNINASTTLTNFSETFTAAAVPISLGANTIYANVTDAAGNINSTFISVTRTAPSSSSGGSGGGGGTSGEEYENIEFKDVSRVYISANTDASFTFSETGNDIQSIKYKALTSAGYISATIEVLKNTSALVKQAPPGNVYMNMNIWVGKYGYATESNIENPVIGFKVQRSWIQDNRIDEDSIKLNRYSEDVWTALPTTRTDEDATFVYFESQTPGFSPFAITAHEKTISSQVSIKSETAAESLSPVEEQPVETTTPDHEIESVEETSMWGYLLIGALILIVAAGAYLYMRKRQS